jgi:parallel beta helix pectate lyase-like protein
MFIKYHNIIFTCILTSLFNINIVYACTVNNLTNIAGPFTSINTALASATSGDVIEFSGTCEETVVINAPITLQGNSGILKAPTPRAKNNAIEINSPGVTIQGATKKSDLRIIAARYGIVVQPTGTANITQLKIKRAFASGILVIAGGTALIDNITVQDGNPPANPPDFFSINNFLDGYSGGAGSGIIVTRNGNAIILNSNIIDNVDIGIHVLEQGIADIRNVTVTGNNVGIDVSFNGGILLLDSDISDNITTGINLFASDTVFIGNPTGAAGNVTIQNNGNQGIVAADSSLNLVNTTISDNGGFSALAMFAGAQAAIRGGNSITHDGASGNICAVNLGGAGTGLYAGFFGGAPDSIALVNEDADDVAVCLNNSSTFLFANATVDGGLSGLGVRLNGNSNADLNNTIVTGDVHVGEHTVLRMDSAGASINGSIEMFQSAVSFITDATVTGDLTMHGNSEVNFFNNATVNGTVTCFSYSAAYEQLTGGSIIGGYDDQTWVQGGCGP